MRNDVRDGLAALAAGQHGVFGRAQALDRGVPDDWLRSHVATGVGRRLRYGAYCFAGSAIEWRGELLAVVPAGGARGRASHRSSAALHGLVGGREDVLEITTDRWRRARHDGLVIHETKAYDAIDTTVVDGIPCTGVARTLLDLGAVVTPTVVEFALDQALRTKLVTIGDLEDLLRRVGRRGRDGAGVLRGLLATRVPGCAAESPQERRMVRMLVSQGLPLPVLQHEIRDGDGVFVARVDAAYPQWRIAVEYDSDEFHSGALANDRDESRRRAIRRVQWDVIAVRNADLVDGCADVARTIRSIRDDRDRFGVRNAAIAARF